MKVADRFAFAKSASGTKAHIVDVESTPSVLIRGSSTYDADTHDRAVCGTISTFDDVGEPDDKDGYCYSCVRTAVARGFVTDPDPFDADTVSRRGRDTNDDDLEIF